MKYRVWVIVAVCLFVAGIIVGVIDPGGMRIPQAYLSELRELSKMLTPSSILTLLIIFFKNVSAMLMSFVFSPFLCLPPLIALVANGWLVGYVAEGAVQEYSLGYVLAGILPHGIFEIPALIMAQASALSFGTKVIAGLFRRGQGKQLLDNLKQNARYLVIACILLVPAAIIETYVTPMLLG